MGRAVCTFGDRTERAANKGKAAFSAFGAVVKGIITTQILNRAWQFLAQGVRDATTEFIAFDKAVTEAGSKFTVPIRHGTVEFERLSKEIMRINKGSEFAFSDAAKGVELLAAAGFNANQAIALLPTTIDLATTSGGDMAQAVSIAADSLGAFGLMTQDTAQLTTNITRVADVFSTAVNQSNAELTDIFASAKFAGPVFRMAGQSLETFTAAASAMAMAGIKGDMAGTTLRQSILALQKPSKQSAAMLKKMGVTISDKNRNMRDFLDILKDIGIATDKMGTSAKGAALATIFEQRAVSGVAALLQAGDANLRKYRMELEKSGNAAKDMADRMRQSLGIQLQVLKNNLMLVGLQVVDTLQKKFPNALADVKKAIESISAEKISAGIDESAFAIETLGEVVKKNQDALIFMVKLGAAIWVIARAQKAWNIAMKANPLLMAVAGTVAWISVIKTIRSEWGFVYNMISETVTAIHLKFVKLGRAMAEALGMDTGKHDKLIAELEGKKYIPTPGSVTDRSPEANRQKAEKLRVENYFNRKKEKETGAYYDGDQNAPYPADAPQSVYAAPNAAQVAATGGWQGTLDIKGAPAGSTLDQKHTGAPRLDAALLGANP
jgi:TP901 family phage tail tape measure protein